MMCIIFGTNAARFVASYGSKTIGHFIELRACALFIAETLWIMPILTAEGGYRILCMKFDETLNRLRSEQHF